MRVKYIESLGRCGAATLQRLSFSLSSLPAGSCPEQDCRFAYDEEELEEVLSHGLSLSPVNECLLEKSIRGRSGR